MSNVRYFFEVNTYFLIHEHLQPGKGATWTLIGPKFALLRVDWVRRGLWLQESMERGVGSFKEFFFLAGGVLNCQPALQEWCSDWHLVVVDISFFLIFFFLPHFQEKMLKYNHKNKGKLGLFALFHFYHVFVLSAICLNCDHNLRTIVLVMMSISWYPRPNVLNDLGQCKQWVVPFGVITLTSPTITNIYLV